MVVVPTSRIILLKNPIEIDYNHELTFASREAQYNYFYNLPKVECERATYQRKEGVIRFPTNEETNVNYDDLIQYNYCMYQNEAWSNKWFYAFIKNVTYDNNGMSYVEIETDVWQTWMFDITFKNSFIEREHVNDDTVGLHTIDEGLEVGDYIIKGCNRVTNKLGAANYIVAVNKYLSDHGMGDMPSRSIYGNLFSGYVYLFFNSDTQVRNLIKAYNGWNQIDNIINIFTIGGNMLNLTPTKHTIASWGSGDLDVYYAEVPDTIRPYTIETGIQFLLNTELDGYTPKNNKMLCYPFNYLVINNNAGNEVVYKYEEALNNTPTFNIEGVICPGCSIKLYPTNYKRYNAIVDPNDPHLYPKEYNLGLTAGKMPNCSWSTDAYTNWLTQNAVNERYDDIRFGYNSFKSVPNEENPASAGQFMDFGGEIVENFLGMQLTRMQRRSQAEFIPNQTRGNANAGDVAYSANILTFYASIITIKYEYAKICDDFLSMYGYKVNSVKLPNITGRTNWNYVKTVGCNIIGDIPQGDLMKIKNMFNNGVTLWHNPSTFLDYSQSNTITS